MAGVQGNIRSFIAPIKGSGRTAPALLEDLTLYAPWRESQDLPNLLASSPLDFVNVQYLAEALPPQSCRHKYVLKPKQSYPPALDERPGPESIWTVAAICQLCRAHVNVKVDYTIRFEDAPCPSAHHPLHHLVRSEFQEPLERNAWKLLNPNSQDEIFTFKCSSHTCSATVTLRFSPPVLRQNDIHILTDPGLLRQRTEDAFRERGGNTDGMKHPGPLDVLLDLCAYLRNSWRSKDDPKYRSINLSNKRFIVRFGPEGGACRSVLEHLGFQLVPGDCWMVPEPNWNDSQPYQSPVNLWLDNAEHELLTLILARPQEERQALQQEIPALVSAERELSRLVGCQDYDVHPSSRTARVAPEMRTSPFIALGCPMDSSDSLIVRAYKWQMQTDPHNTPAYLNSIKHIASQRQSTDLETEVVLETSQGRFDTEMLNEAYRAFHLLDIQGAVSDEDIIGSFAAQLADSPSHEHQLRDYLRIIGVHRNSKRITDTATNVIDTYESALLFLDADPSTEDEHIQALFVAKTAENKSLEEPAIKAVRLIAKERKSQFLSDWIDSGFMSGYQTEMDIGEAYRALGIQDRSVDDEIVGYSYKVNVEENPGSVETYNRAIARIARERNSTILLEAAQGAAPTDPQGAPEEPVGLENIGNTCYLNSLLQFLFTMNELRRLVLDFEEYKMDMNEKSMEAKRVGQRKVSTREVQSAQKFVDSLASLFRGMIQTPQSAIKPEQELARLTLETQSVKDRMRRRSTLKSNERPSLGTIDSMPLLGPLSQDHHVANEVTDSAVILSPTETTVVADPLSKVNTADIDDGVAENPSDEVTMNDNSSEVTLVSKPDSEQEKGENPGQELPFTTENKENVSPIKPTTTAVAVSPWTGMPMEPTASSKLNAQASMTASNAAGVDPELMKFAPPAGKPPPVPPRKPIQNTTTTLEEYARQQDVTEVLNHCIFQLSCAMRPTGFDDKSGEQLDEVHDLFFGQQVTHSQPQTEQPKIQPFLNIITRVFQRPNDVYAAIDNEFDLQEVQSGAKAYTSIAHLPPVLSIALDRVAWNNETKRQEKLNHHVDVPETMYMDRYLESGSDSDLFRRRQQTWEYKNELGTLVARRDELEQAYAKAADIPSLLEDAKLALEHLSEITDDQISEGMNINPNAITTLGFLAENARLELEDIRSQITLLTQQIKESFVDMRKHPYRLHAAFFHRGSAGGGHYWVYIYDHKKELWRKYNDDRVSVVTNRNEIFSNPYTQGQQSANNPPPNSYLLIYLDAEKIATLAETVKRDIVYPPPDQPPPIPARNPPQSQMSAMPPISGSGDVEMLEYANSGVGGAGEQALDPAYPSSDDDLIVHPPEPTTRHEGNWDNSELIADRPINW